LLFYGPWIKCIFFSVFFTNKDFNISSEALLGILESAETSADPVDRLLEAAAMGLGREELGPQATYQELVASGQLALLPRSVRSEVVSHYDRMEGLWSVLQDLPRLNDYVTRVTGYMPIEFLDHGRALTEVDRARLSEALATDEELSRTLREIHADLVFADRRFDETLDGAQTLLEALE